MLTVQAQDTLSTIDRQALQNYQSLKPGKSKFMLRGYYHTGFENVAEGDESKNQFNFGKIAPILMYKQSDRLFIEAEFEGEFEDGKFQWGIEYANMSFVLNKYMTIRAGKFLLPFGTFMEKLHPAWINRLATRPLGFGHDGIAPTTDVGVELRGAFYSGSVKINYQAYVINGPQLKDGTNEPEEAGMLKFGYFEDNNIDKSVGGRIGVFPFSNGMLELGFSGLTGKVGADGSVYENVRANLYAIDFSLVRNVNFLKSMIDLKGQYNYSQISDANYIVPDDTTGLFYDFNNISNSYYVQLSIRPSMIDNEFLRKLELVGRYSSLQTPEGALWEQNPTQTALGLNYWFDWRTVLKLGYQTTDGLGEHDAPTPITQNMFYIHVAMGF
ncbi:MAG: hypothetical protein CL840_18750 [Crocinitomicaceae bacterium]|nr:hypothetical protein [Crocinitomicaceae bacterium]